MSAMHNHQTKLTDCSIHTYENMVKMHYKPIYQQHFLQKKEAFMKQHKKLECITHLLFEKTLGTQTILSVWKI